jgi:N12 class adenine-specific DNA methylase
MTIRNGTQTQALPEWVLTATRWRLIKIGTMDTFGETIAVPVDGQLELRFNTSNERLEFSGLADSSRHGDTKRKSSAKSRSGATKSEGSGIESLADGAGGDTTQGRAERVSLFRRGSKSSGGGNGASGRLTSADDGPEVWLPKDPHTHSKWTSGYDRVARERYEHGQRVLEKLEEEGRGPENEDERQALYNTSVWASGAWNGGDHGKDVADLVGALVKKHCPNGGKIVLGGIGSLSILSEIPPEILRSSLVTIVSDDDDFIKAAKHLTKGVDIRRGKNIAEAGLIPGFYDLGIFPQQLLDHNMRGDETVAAFNAAKNLVSDAGIIYLQAKDKAFLDNDNKLVQKFIQGMENTVELRGAVRKKYTQSTWSSRKTDHIIFAARPTPQATLPGQHFYAKLVNVDGRMVNSYFSKNPEGVTEEGALVKLASSSPNRIYGVDHYVDADDIKNQDQEIQEDQEAGEIAPPEVGYLDYTVGEDGKIKQNVNGFLATVNIFGKEARRLKGMIRLRDEYKAIFSQRVGGDQEEFEDSKKLLFKHYEEFRRDFGALADPNESKPQNALKYFRGAADRSLLCTIDQDYEAHLKGNSSVFSLEYVEHTPERLDDIEDAVRICYHQTGTIYPDQIAENLKMDQDEVVKQITERSLAFFNPEKDTWEPAEIYLSGDIRTKLEVAKLYSLASPTVYSTNVKALEGVLPEPMDVDEVIGSVTGEDVSSGALARVSSWIPEEVLRDFIGFAISRTGIEIKRAEGGRISVTSTETALRGRGRYSGTNTKSETDVFSTKLKRSPDILRYALQGTRPDFDPDAITIPPKTTAKQAEKIIEEAKADHDLVGRRIEDLNKFFIDWVNQNTDQKDKLAKAYNETLNRYVPPKPDMSRVTMEGLSPGYYKPDDHQIFAVARGLVQDGLILHHSPMLGKTFVMGAISNERWSKDRLCKTAMVVPKETFQQAVSEIRKAFPQLPICPCGPKDLTKVPIEQSLNAARLQQGGLVIFTSETFNDIPLPKEVEMAPLYEKIASKERQLAFSADRNAERDAKIMSDIDKLRQQVHNIIKRVDKIPHNISDFQLYGIMVDEAHVFRNLSTNAPGSEGISGAGKSDLLRDKIRFLRELHSEKHQGTGVPPFFTILATGTMTGRKAVDIYNFIDLAAPQILKSCNINSPRDFLNTFARQVVSFRGDPTRPGEQIRCTAYQLMPSPALSQILMSVADTVYAGDVPRVVSTKPKLVGGKANISVCPRSPSQEAYYADIVRRAERGVGPGETLALYGEAVRVAVDPRLVDPRLPSHEDSKVNRVADNIVALYELSREQRGCQLVFCENYSKKAEDPAKVLLKDLNVAFGWAEATDASEHARLTQVKPQFLEDLQRCGVEVFRAPGTYPHPPFARTPEMDAVAEKILKTTESYLHDKEQKILKKTLGKILTGDQWVSLEYNLFRELRNKLKARGVQESDIAIVSELPGSKREAAKSAANSGDVRVLIGSRDVLGKGVNIQTRMIGDHSLDVTWNPDEEWQAQERGPRVGNIFKEFHRYKYVTKNSGEEIVALRNEQKQRSSIAIWLGSSLDAAKNDAMDNLMSTAELTSVISGDFRAKLRSQLHTMVTSLEDQARGKDHERSQALTEIPRIAQNYNSAIGWIRDDRDLMETVASHRARKLPILTVGGEEAKINADGSAKASVALEQGDKVELYGMELAVVEREEKDTTNSPVWGSPVMKKVSYLTTKDGKHREMIGKEGALGALRSFVARVATAERRVSKTLEQEKATEVKLSYLYQKSSDVIEGNLKLARLTEIRDALVEQINDKASQPWERDDNLTDDPEKIAKRLKLSKAKNSKEDLSGKRGGAFLEAMFVHYAALGRIDGLLEKAGKYAQAVSQKLTPGEPALGIDSLPPRDLLVVGEGFDALKEYQRKATADGKWSWALYRKERAEMIEAAEIRATLKWEESGKLPKKKSTAKDSKAESKEV